MSSMTLSIEDSVAASCSAIIQFQTEQQLAGAFDDALQVRKLNRLNLGRIAKALKEIHVERGKGVAGHGWAAFVAGRGLKLSTVNAWILAYARSEGLRQPALPESGSAECAPVVDPDTEADQAESGDPISVPVAASNPASAMPPSPVDVIQDALHVVRQQASVLGAKALKPLMDAWLAMMEQEFGIYFNVDHLDVNQKAV